jgi:hypothetical protein
VTTADLVTFDAGAAEHAARELELTASALLEATGIFYGRLPRTTQDWHGRFRETFDAKAGMKAVEAEMAAQSLLNAAAQIRAGAQEAAAYNRQQKLLHDQAQQNPPGRGPLPAK